MEYTTLLDLVTELGYQLAMSGAETFRVEESINRVTAAYGIQAEAFAIPNCLTVSLETPDGTPMTRMRRIGFHGNDLDSVERFSNLSRKICAEKPEPSVAQQWLNETISSKRSHKLPVYLLGNLLGAAGYAFFFGGGLADSICAAVCGILVGCCARLMERLKVNPFFSTIVGAFVMALAAYIMGALGLSPNTDSAIIGTLMILLPGLLFTNALRDIIFGDTNSGVIRIVQVFLIAAAIALGTGAAWNLVAGLWGAPSSTPPLVYSGLLQCIAAMIGCIGFSIYFNNHGPGITLCVLGGGLTWAAYCIASYFGCGEIISYFIATIIAASYSEIMARVRKCPAISYLVVCIFPLLPGAGIYYTTNALLTGDMSAFAEKGGNTIAIAGALAVGILIVSTSVRLITARKRN